MQTLKEKLDELIHEYGWLEFLDRVAELASVAENECDRRIAKLMEEATEIAKQRQEKT